jgi:hypothetical protein
MTLIRVPYRQHLHDVISLISRELAIGHTDSAQGQFLLCMGGKKSLLLEQGRLCKGLLDCWKIPVTVMEG